MAVKDGRLLEGPGRGPFAGFETSIGHGSKATQKAQKRLFCHTETAWHCGTDRAFEGQLNGLSVKENRALLMLRCLGRLPPAMARARVGGYEIGINMVKTCHDAAHPCSEFS